MKSYQVIIFISVRMRGLAVALTHAYTFEWFLSRHFFPACSSVARFRVAIAECTDNHEPIQSPGIKEIGGEITLSPINRPNSYLLFIIWIWFIESKPNPVLVGLKDFE